MNNQKEKRNIYKIIFTTAAVSLLMLCGFMLANDNLYTKLTTEVSARRHNVIDNTADQVNSANQPTKVFQRVRRRNRNSSSLSISSQSSITATTSTETSAASLTSITQTTSNTSSASSSNTQIEQPTPTSSSLSSSATASNTQSEEANPVTSSSTSSTTTTTASITIPNLNLSNGRMVFVPLPTNSTDAIDGAQYIVSKHNELKGLNEYPIFIFEPPNNMSWNDIINGKYTSAFDAMFSEVSKTFTTGNDLFVPFPEPNLPLWNNTGSDKSDFGLIVNVFTNSMRKFLPNGKASILIDSKTYSDNNPGGSYDSLMPYVSTINVGSLYSVGLQGFNWIDIEEPTYISDDPTVYLDKTLIIEMAQAMQVKNIWFNTGVINRVNTVSGVVTQSSKTRKIVLDRLFNHMNNIRILGYDITLNLFTENKFNTAEGIDWSFNNSTDINNLTNFYSSLKNNNINISEFK